MAGDSLESQRKVPDQPTVTPPVEATPATTNTNGLLVRLGGLVTFFIKLGGLVIAGNEALFTHPPRDPVIFAVAAFMMAGATGLDSLLGNLLGKKE